MNNQNQDLFKLVEQTLDEAKKQGATAAEADIGMGSGLTVTTRVKELEKVEHEREKGLGVTVYINQQKGNASSSDLSEQAIKDTVRAACDIARYASEDAAAGLADAELMATEFPELDLYHPWDISAEDATKLAIECESYAFDADSRIKNSDGCMLSSYAGQSVYGNTHGFMGTWDWSSHMLDCTVIAEDTNGMQRDGWYSKTRAAEDLQNAKQIGEEATRRTVERLGAQKLSTRNCPVIYEAPVASGLFSALLTAISGSALYRKATFLQDSLGQQLFQDFINITEQPHIKRAMGSAPFDNDGVATKQKSIIKDGVLETYILSAYSARKLGMQPTANAGGVHNLIIEPGKNDLSTLIKQMDTGLLITDMIGFGVNQVTGDYSRGASGYWVENGKLQYPVEEITVAGNLKDIYKRILDIGNDVDTRGNIRTGSILIEEMTIAGE